MKRKSYVLAAAVAASIGFASQVMAASQIVSVQFPQFYQGPVNTLNGIGYDSTTNTQNADLNRSAGVVYVNNWNVANTNNDNNPRTVTKNNLIDGQGDPVAATLVDSTNTPTSLDFAFTFGGQDDHTTQSFPYNHAGDQVAGSNADAYLANGAAFSSNASANPVTLTLSGLDPTATYSLIAYIASPWYVSGNSNAPVGSFTVGSTTFYDQPGAISNSSWSRGSSTSASAPSKGNYVEFDNLTGAASQLLTLTGNYVGLSGFQLIEPGITAAPVAPPKWITNGSGDFNNGSNWSDATPNGVDKEADFLGVSTSNHTVYADSNVTLGTLLFDNAHTYVFTGSANLIMSATAASPGGVARVIVNNTAAATGVVQKISLPLELASNTVFSVASGATLKISNPMTIDAGVSLTTSGSGSVVYESTINMLTGSSLSIASSSHAAALTMQGTAAASIAGTGTVLQVDALSLSPTSKLDVGSQKLVVHNGDLASITASVASGFSSGTWNGNGIDSSAAHADTSFLHALGVMKTGTDVAVKYTYYGDTNLDGVVDGTDYSQIDVSYAADQTTPGSVTGWQNGDFNYDNVIDGSDYTLLDNAYNFQSGGISPAASANLVASSLGEIAPASSAVPEPGTLSILAMSAAGLLGRRRRQK